jgi:hypothetical protein
MLTGEKEAKNTDWLAFMVLVNMFTIATSVSKYYKLEGGIIVSRQMSNVSTIS